MKQGIRRGAKKQLETIKFLMAANFPIIYITSWEEERVGNAISEISADLGKEVISWSCTGGLIKDGKRIAADTADPLIALDYILQEREATSFIFYDFHHYLKPDTDIRYIRKVREVAAANRLNPHTLFFVCPVLYIPDELQKDITYIDFPLPDLSDILGLLNLMIKEYGKPPVEVSLTDAEKEEMANAALGLTFNEAERAFSKSLINDMKLTIDDIQEILDEKAQVIKKTQILEYFPPVESFGDVGGLEILLGWLRRRKEGFSESAIDYGLLAPKGILVTGMPGCGKSLCAKAVSAQWHFPLLRLDMGRIFSFVDITPEENLRKAIKTAETIAPCIFWVDEIEKGFPKSAAAGSDTSARLLGYFLTWLQEKTVPVFVFATANDISNVAPELMRRGRFDEIFFVDFPNTKERKAIWEVQFKKHKQSVPTEGFDELIRLSRGFSGAEIEQALIDAMFFAFSDNSRSLQVEDLRNAIKKIKPLSETRHKELAKVAEIAEMSATLASSPMPEEIAKAEVGLARGIRRIKRETNH